MYPTVTSYDGATTTTLCHGVGTRAADEWRLEGAIDLPVSFARQTVEPVRAAFWLPMTRTTRRPRVTFRVSRLYSTLAAAHEARLTWAAAVAAAGTLYIYLTDARRVTCSNAALAECIATQNGLLVTLDYVWEVGAVAAGAYT